MNKPEKFLQGSYPPGSYNQVLQKFLHHKQKNKSKHTVQRIYYSLHPIGDGNSPIRDMTKMDLKNHIQRLKLQKSPPTVRTVIGDMRQFFKWCKKKGYTKKNIAKSIKQISLRRYKSKRARANEKSITYLLQHLAAQLPSDLIYRDIFKTLCAEPSEKWSFHERKTLRDIFIISFLYETGARAGELSGLGTQIMNNVTKQPQETYSLTLYGKTENREMSFTNKTAEIWRIWQQIRPKECSEFAVIGWGNGHKHAQLSTNAISSMIARRCQEAGVTIKFRAHALRRAKINRSRKTVNIETASVLVDHSSLDTTKGYVDIEDEEMSSAIIATGLKLDIWN